MTIDMNKVEAFAGQILGDQGAAITALLVHIGDKLGLYKALQAGGPMTSIELADKTGTAERYVREWLANQAASGYLEYDAETTRFALPPEHAMVLAEETSPAFMVGGFESMAGLFRDEPQLTDAFRTGDGVGWHQHDARLFRGVERFFKPGYLANLTSSWIPALDGVEAKLAAGTLVADVGCGHGASTLVLARTYPQSSFVGFDSHPESIEVARQRAEEEGLADRVRFEVASAQDFPGSDYGLICFFDCLHDMGDPVGGAARAHQTLADDGAVMLVEPMAGDRLEDNLHPVGRLYYGFSTVCCTPASLSQDVGLGLGAQAGEARLTEVLNEAGFRRVRRATETPVNMVLEARK
ncbi:MAG: methyltransferase domain-containing protein [Proteobacteria bacterium]|nr:methyltransferase domain-containing protein [Pseudomonadota bacterium]